MTKTPGRVGSDRPRRRGAVAKGHRDRGRPAAPRGYSRGAILGVRGHVLGCGDIEMSSDP